MATNEATPEVSFVRADDSLYISVGELLAGMVEAEDGTLVIASDDSEGNSFRSVLRPSQGLYLPQSTWHGLFWSHPNDETTMDATMLYERMVASSNDSVEATLIASVGDSSEVAELITWGDIKTDLTETDPDSVVILKSHSSAPLIDSPPSFSPLTEVETSRYLGGSFYEVNVPPYGPVRFPHERIEVPEEFDDEHERAYYQKAMANPNLRDAYFLWPIN